MASEIADRIAVMYAGRIVEEGPVADILRAPLHPYTQGLLASTVHGRAATVDIEAIPGSPPDLRRLPPGCAFAPRCRNVQRECRVAVPRTAVAVAGAHGALRARRGCNAGGSGMMQVTRQEEPQSCPA